MAEAVGHDLLGSLEQCIAKVGALAERAAVRLELRIPADPSLLGEDRSDLVELAPAALAWAIARTARGGEIHIGLTRTEDGMVRLEVAEPTVFGGADESRARVVHPDGIATALPGTMTAALERLASAGGRLLDCGDGERVHLLLLLPNDEADQVGAKMGAPP